MRALSDCRVLLVEDEALVAMDMETTLDDVGRAVIGPVSGVMDAVILVGQEPFDVAVLDVNFNGEKAFPIAAGVIDQQPIRRSPHALRHEVPLRRCGVPLCFASEKPGPGPAAHHSPHPTLPPRGG